MHSSNLKQFGSTPFNSSFFKAKMTHSILTIFVAFVALATGIYAQNPNCPSTNPSSYCRCYPESPGFKVECEGDYATPETMKRALTFYQSYGVIVRLNIIRIKQSVFSYVPDDFLAANQISSVNFECNHLHSVNDGLLMISVNAFKDSFGECGLSGNLTFRDCNLRQFDSAVLNKCNQLKNLAFIDSHVESLIDVPTLRSLMNLTVYSPRQWSGASQRGLSRLALAPGASLPLVSYLDLTGNSLGDNSIDFVTKQTTIEEMHLEGNNFHAVPNLTDCFNLHSFSMTLNSSSSVSILLPDPRDQMQPLKAFFYSTSKTVHDVISLEGMFDYDVINLQLDMTKLDGSVFLNPLLSSNLTINLNRASRFDCGCDIAWLVRDNPSLLDQVNNGICSDGRSFESIPPEELTNCPNEFQTHRYTDQLRNHSGNLKSLLNLIRKISDGL